MIALFCICFVFARHLMAGIDVIALCMISNEPMYLLKPFDRGCACIARCHSMASSSLLILMSFARQCHYLFASP